MNQTSVLRVRTRALAIASKVDLTKHLPKSATVFLRDGEGMVGAGQVLKLEAQGPKRFEQLAREFSNLKVELDDTVGGLGRGLVAFGSIAFSSKSEAKSVLVIPSTIIGVRDGRAWVTQIWVAGSQEPKQIESLDAFEAAHDEYPSQKVELAAGQISAARFEQLTEKAIGMINSDKLQKLVLARDLIAKVGKAFDLRRAIARLAKRYPNCWVYSIDGTFGASPELLVRVTNSQVSARVLAGTASRGTDPQVDRAIAAALVESTKNNREHEFAVRSLVASLEKLCQQVIADEKPFSLALPNVWHLASDVTGVLNHSQSSLTLAGALHPTAAVAGTPTDKALALIEKLEGLDRGRYAGPVGWLSADGDGEWAIALRGGQLSDGVVRAFAGCGLVAESEPAAELAETELKFQPIRYALD